MQIARVSGAKRIITTARRDINLELSKRLGADNVINVKDISPVEPILELTRGRGADIVFDAAGGSPDVGLSGFETLKQALQITKSGGKVISTANHSGILQVESRLFRNKKFYPMIFNYSKKIAEHLVYLLSTKRILVEPTITHQLTGIEAIPEAFNITGNKIKYNAVNPAQVVIS
jgi:threonine dehydrogenase-like Zn-dependent dehydrogenase